jgi:uncharacterized protein YndB with AHSA1/START domain
MTKHRSFKRLVRLRMDKTGESYTTARRILLAAGDDSAGDGASAAVAVADLPGLVCPDAVIRERTGRGWEEWFDLLDEWGAETMAHRDIARKVAADLGIEPLGWGAQAVTVSYERGKGLRDVGERTDGFAASVTRTVAAPAEQAFAAIADPARRAGWLPDAELRERKRNGTKSIRFDWADDGSRVAIFVVPAAGGADGARSTISVEHARLADADRRTAMKAQWALALDALKAELEDELEGGAADA